MAVLRRTPHKVEVVKPKLKRSTDTGASHYDYDDPQSTRTVKGFFSTRGGTIATGDEGQLIPFDAVFFTKDTVLEANDRVNVALGWASGQFLVAGTEPKARVSGAFDHNEVLLQKDTR